MSDDDDGDFSGIETPETKKDAEIARLDSLLQEVKLNRTRERFLWSLAVIILFNVVFFSVIDNWGGPFALLIIEALFIIVLGKKFGVHESVEFINGCLDAVVHRGAKRGDHSE